MALIPDSLTSDETVPLPGFRAKRGFVLKQKKGQHVRFSVGCVDAAAAPVTAESADPLAGGAVPCTWYQAEAVPRGLSRGSSKGA